MPAVILTSTVEGTDSCSVNHASEMLASEMQLRTTGRNRPRRRRIAESYSWLMAMLVVSSHSTQLDGQHYTSDSSCLVRCSEEGQARVLTAAERGGDEARALLTQYRDDEEVASMARALATRILELWKPDQLEYHADVPWLISRDAPKVTADETQRLGHIESTVAVLDVRVDAHGCVERIRILRGPHSRALRDIVASKVQCARFVPAKPGGKFVSSDTTLSVIIEARAR